MRETSKGESLHNDQRLFCKLQCSLLCISGSKYTPYRPKHSTITHDKTSINERTPTHAERS